MLSRLKNHIALVVLILSFYWAVSIFFVSNNDQLYPLHDFDEDMNKLYSDIGLWSQRRGDFLKAIQSYETALKHRPDDLRCVKNLEYCIKKIKKSFKHLT